MAWGTEHGVVGTETGRFTSGNIIPEATLASTGELEDVEKALHSALCATDDALRQIADRVRALGGDWPGAMPTGAAGVAPKAPCAVASFRERVEQARRIANLAEDIRQRLVVLV